jgi:hypothetical protein
MDNEIKIKPIHLITRQYEKLTSVLLYNIVCKFDKKWKNKCYFVNINNSL